MHTQHRPRLCSRTMTSLSAALSLVLSKEMFSLHRSVNVNSEMSSLTKRLLEAEEREAACTRTFSLLSRIQLRWKPRSGAFLSLHAAMSHP